MSSFQPTPEQSLVTVVRRVNQREVTKRDGSKFTMYDVLTDAQDEPFSTTKRQLAEEAYRYVNGPAEIFFTLKLNGEWKNFYLNNIVAPPPVQEGLQRAQEAQQDARPPQTLPDAPLPSGGLTGPSEKDKAIHRQVATKVAATVLGPDADAESFWNNVRTLAHYYDTGEIPGTPGYEEEQDDIPF